jgi:exodeoxyribonuclease V gamma subunit
VATAPDTPFTFDSTVLRAARFPGTQREEPTRFAAQPLPPPVLGDVSLADLIGFFKDPVKGFFRALDYTLPTEVDGIEDAIPVEIDALQEWMVGDRMLTDMMRGMSPERALNAEWCRGTLPPGQLGWRKAKTIRDQAALLATAALNLRSAPGHAIDVDISLGSDRRLNGTVSPVFGDRTVSVTYSKLDGKHLLAAWIPLLALVAHDSKVEWSAVCVGRNKAGTRSRQEFLGPPQTPASDLLRDLVAIYDAGRRSPVPLPLKTSFAWADARYSGADAQYRAGNRWHSSNSFPGENQQPANARVWGWGAPLSALLDPVGPGEECQGETTRLGAYATRLWLPLLQARRGGR